MPTNAFGSKYHHKKSRYPKSRPSMGGRLANVGMKYVAKGGTAYKALKLARRLADAVNIEYKESSNTNTVQPTNNGFMSDLTFQIAQGVANGARIGDSVKLQRLTMRIYTDGITNNEIIRMLIVEDKTNSIAATNNLLQYTGSVYGVISPKLEQTKFNSRILYDHRFKLIPNSDNALSFQEFSIPLNFHTNYTPASTVVTTGALKLFLISNTVAATLGHIVYTYELSYTDD